MLAFTALFVTRQCFVKTHGTKNVHIESKYCPNCGAKMDGKHEKL